MTEQTEIKPNYPDGAIEFINNYLIGKTNTFCFEYGSGWSTVYWAKRFSYIVSIEHDLQWYDLIKAHLKDNCAYRFIPEEQLDRMRYHESNEYRKYLSRRTKKIFRNYVQSIEDYPRIFDVVMIDGRARPGCILHAVYKVKSGGLLMVDDSQRDYYQRIIDYKLRKYTSHTFSRIVRNEHVKTTIWRIK